MTPGQALTMDGARREVGPGVRIVGVIGSPVAHSLSPLLHNSAFAALGLADSWRSFAFEVAPGEAPGALEDMRRADVSGLSVTMPHKAAVAALVECSDTARRLDAVNCVVNSGGSLSGTNTDGEGFVASLARGASFDPAGRRCLVVGAGGAARAVVLALARAGAAHVAVVNRTPDAGRRGGRAGRPGGIGRGARRRRGGRGRGGVRPGGQRHAGGDGGSGGRGAGWWPRPCSVPVSWRRTWSMRPAPRRWLAEAAARGATVLDGLGMLVHQAAAQLVLWTGAEPPVEAMWHAAEAASPPEP